MNPTTRRGRPAALALAGLSYIAVGHNHDRGTVRNAVPLCELLVVEGYVGNGS